MAENNTAECDLRMIGSGAGGPSVAWSSCWRVLGRLPTIWSIVHHSFIKTRTTQAHDRWLLPVERLDLCEFYARKQRCGCEELTHTLSSCSFVIHLINAACEARCESL
jgi:hypothetical protein